MTDLQQTHDLFKLVTPREMQIVKEMADGYTDAEIGEHLGISFKTVNVHRHAIKKKTGCRNAVHVVASFLRANVIA